MTISRYNLVVQPNLLVSDVDILERLEPGTRITCSGRWTLVAVTTPSEFVRNIELYLPLVMSVLEFSVNGGSTPISSLVFRDDQLNSEHSVYMEKRIARYAFTATALPDQQSTSEERSSGVRYSESPLNSRFPRGSSVILEGTNRAVKVVL